MTSTLSRLDAEPAAVRDTTILHLRDALDVDVDVATLERSAAALQTDPGRPAEITVTADKSRHYMVVTIIEPARGTLVAGQRFRLFKGVISQMGSTPREPLPGLHWSVPCTLLVTLAEDCDATPISAAQLVYRW